MSFRPIRPLRRSRSKYGAEDIASTFTTSIGFRKWDVPPAAAQEQDALKRFASGVSKVDATPGKTHTGLCGAYPHYTFGYVAPSAGSALARRAILVKQDEKDSGRVILEGADYDATLLTIGKNQQLAQHASCAPVTAIAPTQPPSKTIVSDIPPTDSKPPSKGFDFAPLLVAAGAGALAFHLLKRKDA